jgi:putrescine transport system permease protein
MRRAAVLLPPWLWLLFLVAAPVAVLVAIALAAPGDGVPPISSPIGWEGGRPVWLGGEALAVLVEEGWHIGAFGRSFRTAFLSALLCLLLAYPMALGVARARPERRTALLLLVMLPFWTGFLPRVGAWIGLLRDGGWVNGVLMGLGLIEAPLPLLYTEARCCSAWSTPTCPSPCCRWWRRWCGLIRRWRKRRRTSAPRPPPRSAPWSCR